MVGMADGFAQASGRTTVVNLHTAPGVGNAMGAIFNAQANHSPLLVTAGQQARAQITLQANLTNRDAIRMPHPLVKWAYEPAAGRGRAARARPRRPPRRPAAERPGLRLAADGRLVRRGRRGRRRATRSAGRVSGRAVADPEAVARSRRALDAATNPVLVAGPDIDASGGWDAAVALAERQRLPVWASPATGGVRLGFPENHPNFRGVLPPAIGPVGQTLEGHDLILVVGSSVFPYYPYIPGPLLPEGASLVAITSDPDEAARAPMGDAIVADVKLTLEALLEAVPESSRPAPEPNAGPQEIPAERPAQLLDRAHGARRGPARGRDRRPRVALQHPGAAQPAAPLAPRQLLLQRRRRPRLRPRRLGRRAARPARPPGRLRDRRGLGPVRGQRLLERRRLQDPGHLPRPAQLRVRDPQVVRRGRAGRPAPPASTCRRSTSPRSPTATASTRPAPPSATRSAAPSRRRSPPRSRSWSKSRSPRECRSSRAMSVAAPDRAPDSLATGAAQPLRGELEALLGADRVLARASDIVRYASDASPYRLLPAGGGDGARRRRRRQGRSTTAARKGIPVTFRAGGTSLNGQGQSDGILVDVRRHFGGVAVEDDGAAARVKPGTVLGHANRVLAPHGRKLGPDPASTDIACVGGVIANNSGGMRCGTTRDSYSTVRSLTFVLPSGTTIDTAAPGAAERFEAAEPELAAGLAAIRDEIRADAELSERIRAKFAIKNTTGYRLCAFLDADEPLEIFRRLAGRLRGDARLRRRGGLRDGAAARPHDHRLDPLPRHRRGDRAGPRLRRGRRHRGRADGRPGADHRRLEHGRRARGVERAAARVGGAAGRVRRRDRRGARRRRRQGRGDPRRPRDDPRRSTSPATPRRSSSPGGCARACTA